MPVRIRRGFQRRRTRRTRWLDDAIGRVADRVVHDFIDSILDPPRRPVGPDQPHDPFWQLDETCPTCGLRLYESGNQITVCLACWTRFDRASSPEAAPEVEAEPPIEWTGPAIPRRGYKVPRARPRRPPAQPSPAPRVVQALALLGLAHPTTPDAIKRRRRELALVYHPDRGGPGASTAKLVAVNQAADALMEFYSRA